MRAATKSLGPPLNCSEAAAGLKRGRDLIQTYSWLVECKSDLWIVDAMWSRVPAAWQVALLALPDEALARLPMDLPCDPNWPSDLLEFINASRQMQHHVVSPERGPDAPTPVSRWLGLDGLSPKKRHEVERLAPLVHDAACLSGADIILDIGAGLGYLSAVLAFHYGHTVVCVEADASNVTRAKDRAHSIRARLVGAMRGGLHRQGHIPREGNSVGEQDATTASDAAGGACVLGNGSLQVCHLINDRQ